ncbi:ABC transporter permease [Gulosibacter sp. 10]|uniref:ABC transporter permease n=1 Tax=Gulosibacter sp. 10 TaxID=1255570 RepID=UPI00097F2810|nr:ABC transporter permease [Gulosibacter sp. 10]SJM71658.1 ABC transporter permease protein [Gulosibacter sp. 10]
MTATTTRPAARRVEGRAGSLLNLRYTGLELVRNLRMFTTLFFMIVLPATMFLIFGAMQEFSDLELESGRGNVAAQIMLSMAAYGAITATVGTAGAAAVELQQGWGRQLGLTPFRRGGYVLSKTIVALILAVLPILAVFLLGILTTARMDAWIWPVATGLILLGSVVFALYGLAFGLAFRSESAVGAASGLIVILMFLGNAFMPLSGFLLDMSVFTPVWGVMQLALWPLNEGVMYTMDAGPVTYALWQPLLNILVWAAIFAVLCLLGMRRGTSRR